MSNKNTALILGLAAVGALLLFSKSGDQAASNGGGNGGGGGGVSDAWLPYVPEYTPAQQTINDVVKKIFATGGASIGPASPDYGGGVYPALDVNEAGLFVNRATGEVYPVDPVTGRQRARVENGEVVGRYIASEQGVPYGTYEYQAIPKEGISETIPADVAGLPNDMVVTHKKTSTANVLITSKATGITQAALVGTNPSTGAGYVWYGTQGW